MIQMKNMPPLRPWGNVKNGDRLKPVTTGLNGDRLDRKLDVFHRVPPILLFELSNFEKCEKRFDRGDPIEHAKFQEKGRSLFRGNYVTVQFSNCIHDIATRPSHSKPSQESAHAPRGQDCDLDLTKFAIKHPSTLLGDQDPLTTFGRWRASNSPEQ